MNDMNRRFPDRTTGSFVRTKGALGREIRRIFRIGDRPAGMKRGADARRSRSTSSSLTGQRTIVIGQEWTAADAGETLQRFRACMAGAETKMNTAAVPRLA